MQGPLRFLPVPPNPTVPAPTFGVFRFLPLQPKLFWEVLNGVGVDGVGVIFLFFTHFSLFYAFFRFASFFFAFLRFLFFLLKDKDKQQQFTANLGNFTPTPSATDPVQNFRNYCRILYRANGRGGFGSQTAADPLWWPPQSPWKEDRGYCDSISQNANPASAFELSQFRHCKEGLPGPRRGFWVPSVSLSPKTAASICIF